MQELIEQLADNSGVNAEVIYNTLIAFTGILTSKIPALQQVLNDVIDDECDEKLKEDIGKLVTNLQSQQWKERFGNCNMPVQATRILYKGEAGAELF